MKTQADTYDIAVVGAGPAGSHFASLMAVQGYSVALLDHRAPWEKPCGGGITHKAWSMFPILADSAIPRREVFQSLQVSQRGRFFVIDQGHALLIVNRKDLQNRMLEQSITDGAVHIREKVVEILPEADRTALVTSEGRKVRAKLIVGADGVRSIVRRRMLGRLPKNRTLTALCRLYAPGKDDPTMIKVTPFPGYIWSFARPDALSVGIGSLEPGHNLMQAMDDYVAEYFPGRVPIAPYQGAMLPYMRNWKAFFEPRVGKRFALLGDAAGFCDTLTGEGILYALWSAQLLAEAVSKGRIESYDNAWRKVFGHHLLLGAFIARGMFSRDNVDRFFTALTVCPSFRKVFMNFVWKQPPYPVLFGRLLSKIPAAYMEWRAFRKAGAQLSPEDLGPFSQLADRVSLDWR